MLFNNSMQNNILPDFLLDKVSKHNHQLNLWRELISHIQVNEEKFFDIEPSIVTFLGNPHLRKYFDIAIKDKGFIELTKNWKLYLKSGRKNYLFSPYLGQILMNTSSTKITTENFPDSLCCYIEIPNLKDFEDSIIMGTFVNVFTKDDKKIISLASVTNESARVWEARGYVSPSPTGNYETGMKDRISAVNWLHIHLDKGESLDSALSKFKFQNSINGEVEFSSFRDKISWQATVLNSILFIAHCTEELKEKYNEFATKISKANAQKNMFTTQGFFFCDMEKPKNFSVHSTFIRGFNRWQRHGPKFSKVKLIYIQPNKRHYKKSKNQPIIEKEILNEDK